MSGAFPEGKEIADLTSPRHLAEKEAGRDRFQSSTKTNGKRTRDLNARMRTIREKT